MKCREGGFVSWGDTAAALVGAHARYWSTVAPRVRRELRRWYDHAERIRDPILRAHAADKLRDERANTEVIATLYTLSPRGHRKAAVAAAVALQVMYDYLDAVNEQLVDDPLLDGRQLFRSFAVALTPGEMPVDYYLHHPQNDDSGYLDALVDSCRESLAELPSIATVLPVARDAVARFSEAQTRSHAVPIVGASQLEHWAGQNADAADLLWWEWAGGAAASILGVHALLSAAADVRTTSFHAVDIDRAYLLSSTLTTMLDSLIDDERDATDREHRYIAYYPSTDLAACRIAAIARRAVAAARELPHAAHHAMTVAGIAAFYLSDPDANVGSKCVVAARVTEELKPIIVPILGTFRLWRHVRTS
jgi:tetraprenyl-beta-curcumene synthase